VNFYRNSQIYPKSYIVYLIGQNNRTKVTKYFEGDENLVRQRLMFDENFVQECLHLQAVLLDKVTKKYVLSDKLLTRYLKLENISQGSTDRMLIFVSSFLFPVQNLRMVLCLWDRSTMRSN